MREESRFRPPPYLNGQPMPFLAWTWATRGRRLVSKEIGDRQLLDISRGIVPEPMTAFITIWASFLGSTAWELAWLMGLPISYFVKRIGRA